MSLALCLLTQPVSAARAGSPETGGSAALTEAHDGHPIVAAGLDGLPAENLAWSAHVARWLADPPGGVAQLPGRSNVALRTMQVMISIWIFVLGACFGSFLNVVIYRLPAGLSLGRPKSRCPRCETPLSARDNLPIVGWLSLKGKCRYCQLPIALRYPTVETICGVLLLVLMFGELLTGAANLPRRHPDHFGVHSGFWLVWFAKWDLSGIYAYHACLTIITLATLLIGFDGHLPQKKLTRFGLGVALLLGTMWPELRPVHGLPWPADWHQYRLGFRWGDLRPGGDAYWTGIVLTGWLDGVLGVAIGWLVGRACQLAIGHGSQSETSMAGAVGATMMLTGGFLGWQGAAMLGIVCVPILVAARLTAVAAPRRFRAVLLLWFPAQVAFLLLWEWLDQNSLMIGIRGWEWTSLIWWQDWLIALSSLFGVCLLISLLPKPDANALAAVSPTDERVTTEQSAIVSDVPSFVSSETPSNDLADTATTNSTEPTELTEPDETYPDGETVEHSPDSPPASHDQIDSTRPRTTES